MIRFLLGLINPLGAIADKIATAYVQKTNAQTERERIAADERIRTLEARRDVLLAEQEHWLTRSIRPLMALPIVILLWKLIVWDKVLGWGVTDRLSPELNQILMLVVGAYFLDGVVARFRR